VATHQEARSGRWLLRVGSACFVVGLVFVGIVFLPFFAGSSAQPALAAVGTMLGPVGFALVLFGLVRQARANNRAARDALRAD
jgi:tellurite resistance protein TehA-like permease